jgi:fatty acid desaturase
MASFYSAHAQTVKQELAAEIDPQEVRRLHKIQPWRHFLIVLRQILLLTGCVILLVQFDDPLLWIPIAFALGFTVFNFTVLLHEVVHNAVFVPGEKSRLLNRIVGLFYAFPSGISASQFTRWHLDHHAELGSTADDPKRFHLSPKKNKDG